MARVRGASIRGTLDYARVVFGEDAPGRVLGALSPETRRAIGDGGPALLVNGWYDCGALVELTRELDRLYGTGDLTLARAAGKYIAFEDVNRFFKWMLRLVGPRTLFNRAASVWNNYHDEGRYVAEDIGPEHASLRIENWPAAHPIICKRIEGWIERALELTLGPDVRPTIHESHHLAQDPSISLHPFCRYVAEWKP